MNIADNYDEQIKLIKVSTLTPILNYRFPDLHLGFLYTLDAETLDSIINQVTTITLEELLEYKS